MRKWRIKIGIATLFMATLFGVQLAEGVMTVTGINDVLPPLIIPFLGDLRSVVKSAITSLFTMIGIGLIKSGVKG